MCKKITLLFMISIFSIPAMSQEYNLKQVKEIHEQLEIEPKDEEWIDGKYWIYYPWILTLHNGENIDGLVAIIFTGNKPDSELIMSFYIYALSDINKLIKHFNASYVSVENELKWIDYESDKIYQITQDIENELVYVDVKNRN
ncbi:MAG: hypothetical protein PF448_06620 [Bacteroidales bacterium]|jgi:hypothetical protein|nr:hypothetical protein [Bacteroidales bacterium]